MGNTGGADTASTNNALTLLVGATCDGKNVDDIRKK
jgi:hypothetical protein